MNISDLRGILTGINEIKVIGKSAILDGVACNVMGFVRNGTELRLLSLIFDESFYDRITEIEAEELNQEIAESNRKHLKYHIKNDVKNPFLSVQKLSIGEKEFKADLLESWRLDKQDYKSIMTIAKFLENGWQPAEMEYHSFDCLLMNSLKICGDYESIPDFSSELELRLEKGPYNETHLVEKPIALTIGKDYKDKIIFKDEDTGEEHWFMINRVYLTDMWEEINKVFSNPKLKEQMAPGEIEKSRKDFEEKFKDLCPKGMYYPIIEYESEDDIYLQFFSKSFLDAKPFNKGRSMGFIIRPDQPTGFLGLKLKAAIIQEPVPKDTETIEAELFQYSRFIDGGYIIIE